MDYLNRKWSFYFLNNKNFAFTDPLTGLNNVRSFDLRLNKAKKDQIETNETIFIILLDIDRFKTKFKWNT